MAAGTSSSGLGRWTSPPGLDHTTVAKHLRAARAEEHPLVYQVEGDRGSVGGSV